MKDAAYYVTILKAGLNGNGDIIPNSELDKIATNMVAPLKVGLDYAGISRKLFKTEPFVMDIPSVLDDGMYVTSSPIFVGDIPERRDAPIIANDDKNFVIYESIGMEVYNSHGVTKINLGPEDIPSILEDENKTK